MVEAALAAGGKDNATAVVIDVVGLVTENNYDSERQRLSSSRSWGHCRERRSGPHLVLPPRDWFGVFGPGAAVVLPPSEKARVAALWELVDDGAGFDEVLDALISDGLRDLPGFVLVSEVDGETKVVIRGAARAHFATPAEVVLVEGAGATTWVERTLRGVSRVRIEVADETDEADLVIGAGLVRLATVGAPRSAGRGGSTDRGGPDARGAARACP